MAAPTSPPKPASTAANSPSRSSITNGENTNAYEPGKPIVFYDDEMKRMHKELEQRDQEQALAARRRRRAKRSKGVSVQGFLARVAVFYFLIAYFLVCPSDTSRERAVCRGLDTVHSTLAAYEPRVRPYLTTAHRKLDPYISLAQSRAQPYVKQVQPYYTRADSFVRPYASQSISFYRTSIRPHLEHAVALTRQTTRPILARLGKQYQHTLAPSVEWYSRAGSSYYAKNLKPHFDVASNSARQVGTKAYDVVAPVYHTGLPLAKKHYYASVLPWTKKTSAATQKTYYRVVHPQVLTVGKHGIRLYQTRILPTWQRFYSLFVAPQLDKISERIFEYRAKKSEVEATKKVKEVEQKIVADNDADDFEDFIAELRSHPTADDDLSQLPSDAVPPPSSTPADDTPLSAEEQAAVTATKRAALEELQTTYEKQITSLGHAQHALLLERLVSIRGGAVDDIPRRFGAVLTSLDEEGDKMVGRLGKYFAKVAGDEKTLAENKAKDAEFLSKKAVAKVVKLAEEVKHEVETYREDLVEKEAIALKAATDAVGKLVAKAQEELGFGWTWLDGVRHSDWQRYHTLGKADTNWKESYTGLVNGAISDSSLSGLKPHSLLDEISVQADSIVTTFESILGKILLKGTRELRGEWTGVVNEAQKAAAAAASAASSLVGVTVEPTPTNVLESASSIASVVQASAASLAASAYEAIPTVEVPNPFAEPTPTDLLGSASSRASSAYAEASQAALRAAGIEPSPTDLAQSATSLAKVVEASASSAYEAVYTGVLEDGPSAASSIVAQATQAIDHLAEEAVSTAIAAASSISSLAAAPLSSLLAPAPIHDGIGESVKSVFAEASQTIISAVGGEPSPTDVKQSVESVAGKMSRKASSVLNDVVGAGSSIASQAQATAVSVGEEVVSSASSVGNQASSVVASVQSQASTLADNVESLAAPHSSFSTSIASASASSRKRRLKSKVNSAASGAGASVSSVVSQASQAVHDATRTTAEGVQETAQSVASAIKSKVAEVVHQEL